MRILFAAVALLLATLASDRAAAAEYPWCAYYGDDHGGINCGFTSWQQCRATISGNGGDCQPNPFYAARTAAQTRKAKRQ